MDGGVAVRAARIKGPGPLGGNTAALLRIDSVALVALEAQKRLPRVQQPAVNRTMGAVAVEAVLRHIRMLVKEGTSLVRMALDTGFLDAVLLQTVVGEPAMGVVAVDAEYPPLLEGMVAGQGKLGLSGLMAGKTEFARGQRGDLQIRPGVDIMAGETGYLVEGVESAVPVMQVERGVDRMALEADERLGRGGKFFQVDQRLEITGGLDALTGVHFNQLFGQTLDRKAAGPMAGFTIHQGHAGFLFQLGAHGAGVKEQLQPVMLMTGGKTVPGAHIIGIEIADNHLLIFADRQNRL